MQYCIYLRKSRSDIEAESRGEGETLKRHEEALLSLANRLHISISKIFREIVSGETIASRPEMQNLLTEVENGLWDGVLVMEVERLARGDTIDQGIVAQTFKYSNTKIITPLKTYDPSNESDEEYFEFGLFMSRREYKTINRRLQNGRIASVKEGKYVGNTPPYGYRRIKLENQKGFTLEPIPEEARVVQQIFNWYTTGIKNENGITERIGVSKICRALNDLSIPPARGDVWVPSTIQGMLRNPVYIGKVRWNFRKQEKKMQNGVLSKSRPRAKKENTIEVKGLHKPIIKECVFNKANEYLSENETRPCPSNCDIKNPLAGIIKCGLCGRNMVRRPYQKRGQLDTLMCPVTACKNVSSKLVVVEERLLSSLADWAKEYKLKIESDTTFHNEIETEIKKESLKKLQNELKSLEKQKDSLYDLLERGIYTTDVFIERSNIVATRIESTSNNINKIEKEIENDEQNAIGIKEIIPRVEKVLSEYSQTTDPVVKNRLLHEVLKNAVYYKNSKSIKTKDIDNFELIIFPKLPK